MQVLSELKADDLPYVPFNDELDAPPISTEPPSGMNRCTCSISNVTFLCVSYGYLYLMKETTINQRLCLATPVQVVQDFQELQIMQIQNTHVMHLNL